MKLFKIYCEYPKQPNKVKGGEKFWIETAGGKILNLKGYLCGFDSHIGEPHFAPDWEDCPNYNETELEPLVTVLEKMGFKVETHELRV